MRSIREISRSFGSFNFWIYNFYDGWNSSYTLRLTLLNVGRIFVYLRRRTSAHMITSRRKHPRVIAYYYTRIDCPRLINQRSTSELETVMTSVEVTTPTVHLRLRPGGSPWSRSRVERQTRERASGTDSSNDLLLKPSGFIFKTFTVNARLASHSALCLNKLARTNHLKR